MKRLIMTVLKKKKEKKRGIISADMRKRNWWSSCERGNRKVIGGTDQGVEIGR